MNKLFYLLLVLLMGGLLYAQDASTENDYDENASYQYTPVNWNPILDAAGDWCPVGTFPNLPVATYYQASDWVGDTLYVHAPVAGAPTDAIYTYALGGSWSTGVPLPTALVGGSMTACNGKLYYIGGSLTAINGTGSTNLFEYDPSTGVWTAKAPMPAALAAHGSVCWGDSVIFVIGGPYSGSATNLDVHYYRVASDTWGTISNSLPSGEGRRTYGHGIYDNKIVICAGYNAAFLKSTFVGTIGSDASQITWNAAPDVPTVWSGLSRPGGVAVGKYFFLVNGEAGGSPTTNRYYDTTHVFDIETATWVDIVDNKPFKMSNIFNGVAGKVVNDSIRIYVPGGYGSVSGATPGAGTDQFDAVSCGELIYIPVEFTAFSADVISNDVNLTWKTATELNNSGFEIERKLESGFEGIAFIPGSGTTTESRTYSYTDEGLVAGNYTYRLKQIDYDGTFEYSNTVNVVVGGPVDYSLLQNYPNPFNPSTLIEFSLASDSKVNLTVFDLLGQEVTNLVNQNLTAGLHEINFDASSLNSGVYFYRINATGVDGTSFTSIKKMILTK